MSRLAGALVQMGINGTVDGVNSANRGRQRWSQRAVTNYCRNWRSIILARRNAPPDQRHSADKSRSGSMVVDEASMRVSRVQTSVRPRGELRTLK